MLRIENWAIIYRGDLGPFIAPEDMKQCVIGKISKNTDIITSPIRGKRGINVVTQNNEYELGEVDPEYEKEYPNARQRFLNSAKEISPNEKLSYEDWLKFGHQIKWTESVEFEDLQYFPLKYEDAIESILRHYYEQYLTEE